MGEPEFATIRKALDEAPLSQARWTDALNGVAAHCNASSAQILTFGGRKAPSIIAPGFSAADIAYYVSLGGPDPRINCGVRTILRTPTERVVADVEYISDHERARDVLYQEFFEPHGGTHASFAVLHRADMSTTVVNLFHSRRQGTLTPATRRRLQRLMPYFQRAIRLQGRFENDAAQIAVGALDSVSAVVLLCDYTGRVVGATRRAEDMLRRKDVLTTAAGRLITASTKHQSAMEDAIRSAAVAATAAESKTLVMFSFEAVPVRIDVVPFQSAWSHLAIVPMALVHIQMPEQILALDFALVQRTFRLTPAECAVAAAVIRGDFAAEIAAQRGSTVETVNSQVKGILAKTGCHRRSELALVLTPFLRR